MRALTLLTLTGCAIHGYQLDSPIGQADLGVQPTASPTVARFVVVGDIGVWSGTPSGPDSTVVEADLSEGFRSVAAEIRAACAARPCDFVVVTGDNLYENGIERDEDAAALQRMVDTYGLPTWFVLGNHDWRWFFPELETARRELRWIGEADGARGEAHFWRMTAGPAAFWGLDSNLLVRHGELADDRWVDAFLRDIARDQRHPWRIAVAHHPIYSNGQHGDAGRFLDGGHKLWRGGAFRTAMDTHVLPSVDLWLNGHDHNLQLFTVEGTAFLTSGAGAKCSPAGERAARLQPGRPEPAMTRFERGFAIVDASDDALEVTFHSVGEGAFWSARRATGDATWTFPSGPSVDETPRCEPGADAD
jgi:tartrate-resistant acid phosphatase type 5